MIIKVHILVKVNNLKKKGKSEVFTLVLAVLRCLGIPTRLITNFSSAHDTDGNLSVDMLMNERMETIGEKDSTW